MQTSLSLISPDLTRHLLSAIGKLAKQLDQIAESDISQIANSRALNAITRALKDNTRLLTTLAPGVVSAPHAPTKPPRTEPVQPPQIDERPLAEPYLPQANSAHSAAPRDSVNTPSDESPPPIDPVQAAALAAIRSLPQLADFRKRFTQAWASRHPDIKRSRINAAYQSLLLTLAEYPEHAAKAVHYIIQTKTYTSQFDWAILTEPGQNLLSGT